MLIIFVFIATFLLNFSCSKDSDTLSNETTDDNTVSVVERDPPGRGTDDGTDSDDAKDDVEDDKGELDACATLGGRANETGLKTWCWGDVTVPSGAGTGRDSFSNGQLALNIECSANQVLTDGNRLKFVLDPINPSAASWCPERYNMRSEIRTMPWNVDHAAGTEEWIGFTYGFGDNYLADPTNNWVFYQVHEGTIGASPLLSLQIDGRQASSYAIGELVLVNASQPIGDNKNSIYGTNVIPAAGQSFDIVMHVIWGDDSIGLWQVWINGVKVHDLQARTVRAANPVGGNSKFGIYYAPWRSQSGIESSAAAGVTQVETFMGPLRMITRRPGDAGYGEDAFEQVVPR